ncbi:MAG: hypothetical protein QHH12_04625 [Candidatus Bathyarchaeota archaeon]|jgi:hypothetical protein|nr:hypothetical protein [Candidatus Bathyarchaeota archaeon A05DMB-3]MDH7607037.1 hypothetical protein [Candidatus Bathyarchaeota archaeon]
MKEKMVSMLLIGFLTALIFSCSVVYAIPSINAKVMTLKFLEDVVGVNMANYQVVSFNASTARMPDSPHYQTNIKVMISNATNQLEALITLVDAKMWTYSLQGEFRNSNLTLWDRLKVAYKSLASYQKFVGTLDYNRMLGVLSTAMETKNQQIEDEEFALNIQYTENCSTLYDYMESTVIRFARKVNGYKLPGDYFVMSFSKDGWLTRIVDNTIFYVATTVVNVSMEQAISKALPYAETYARSHGQKVNAVNATFEFTRDIGCVRGDNFAIYPQWKVWITFDKANEENVFGYAVMIWADNGEVYHHGPQGYRNPPASESVDSHLLWLVAVTAIIFPVSVAYMVRARRRKR